MAVIGKSEIFTDEQLKEIDEYFSKYCAKHKCTFLEATQHAIVKEYLNYKKESADELKGRIVS